MTDKYSKSIKPFVVREFEEVPGGFYECDFYYTPNGSFWDDEGYYFNREGKDKHGGYYDEKFNYVPGESWDEVNQTYFSEIEGDSNDEDEVDEFEFEYKNYNNKKAEEVYCENDYLNNYGVDAEKIIASDFTKITASSINIVSSNIAKENKIKKEGKIIVEPSNHVSENFISTETEKKVEAPKKNKLA